jgi:hypothetical protein
MSTAEEIREVFEGEIEYRTRVVMNKYGPAPFYDGLVGMGIQGVLPEEFLEVCAATGRADEVSSPCSMERKRGADRFGGEAGRVPARPSPLSR